MFGLFSCLCEHAFSHLQTERCSLPVFWRTGTAFNQEKQLLPLVLHLTQVLQDISGRSWSFGVQQRPPWEMDQEDGESG